MARRKLEKSHSLREQKAIAIKPSSIRYRRDVSDTRQRHKSFESVDKVGSVNDGNTPRKPPKRPLNHPRIQSLWYLSSTKTRSKPRSKLLATDVKSTFEAHLERMKFITEAIQKNISHKIEILLTEKPEKTQTVKKFWDKRPKPRSPVILNCVKSDTLQQMTKCKSIGNSGVKYTRKTQNLGTRRREPAKKLESSKKASNLKCQRSRSGGKMDRKVLPHNYRLAENINTPLRAKILNDVESRRLKALKTKKRNISIKSVSRKPFLIQKSKSMKEQNSEVKRVLTQETRKIKSIIGIKPKRREFTTSASQTTESLEKLQSQKYQASLRKNNRSEMVKRPRNICSTFSKEPRPKSLLPTVRRESPNTTVKTVKISSPMKMQSLKMTKASFKRKAQNDKNNYKKLLNLDFNFIM